MTEPASAAVTGPRGPLRRALTRYGVAGILNTLVGGATILTLDLWLGVDAFVANAAGYAVGLVSAFALNRWFVFAPPTGSKAPRPLARTGLRYAAAVLVAFALNQLVLAAILAVAPPLSAARIAAQLAGMATYTVAMFILSYRWVFARR